VLVLGLIVLIRTFLRMALQLELEGRWPWQRAETSIPDSRTVERTTLPATTDT
jgi:hypothetical protein